MEFVHSYHIMDQSISSLRVIRWYFSFFFYFLFKLNLYFLKASSGDRDQIPRSVASDLDLNCLRMFNKKGARLM